MKTKDFLMIRAVFILILTINTSLVNAQTVTDKSGNSYQTIIIGNQEWMAENLRTKVLNDGIPIPEITDNSQWTAASNPAWCWYNNDSANYHLPYGRMYNGHTALNTKICPEGWYLPTNHNWDSMINYLGGSSVAGGKMKMAGTTYWDEPNTGADNSSGFTGVPGGFRSNTDGSFKYIRQRGGWFVGTSSGDLAFRFLSWSMEQSGSGQILPHAGLSIRCFRPVNSSINDNNNNQSSNVVVNQNQQTIIIHNAQSINNIIVTDVYGRLMKTISDIHTDAQEIKLPAKGIYLLRISYLSGKTESEKVIIF